MTTRRFLLPERLARTLALVVLLTACASAPKERPRAPPPDPGELLLMDLESKLMRARSVHLKAKVVATGAVTATLDCELWLKEGNRARLDVSGLFEGRHHRSSFTSDGALMKVGARPPVAAAPRLREAFVYGKTRIALLPNAALLIAGEAPEHADDAAHGWVKAERARSLTPATKIAFDVVIMREPRGEVVMQLDSEGREVERSVEVRLDVGTVKIVERYRLFEVDGEIDDAVFALPTG